jgi:LacI family transcriptional regulator
MAVEHLLQNNHTAIAFINSNEARDYTVDRRIGYTRALAAAGITPRREWMISTNNSMCGGQDAAKQLLAVGGFTAIFCTTDIMSIGVVNAIQEAGLRVPDDISLVSFDGLGYHRITEPLLTTIAQPVFEIGKALAQLVIDRVANCDKQRTVHLMLPTLIQGKSVQDLVRRHL